MNSYLESNSAFRQGENRDMITKPVFIVYGVSGSGKTTIGSALAKKMEVPFYDADDFHPESNIQKMAKGFPLNDDDRAPWLQDLANNISKWSSDQGGVLACSALKVSYRNTLASVVPKAVKWIFLEGSYELIFERMQSRKDHFFTSEMLQSQFDTLEVWKEGVSVDIDQEIQKIVEEIESKLKMQKSEIGVIGLGVMGKSLATNILSKGFRLSVFNRHLAGKEEDIAKNFVSEHSNIPLGFDDLSLFVASLAQPRTILMMVNAGPAVDVVVEQLLPLLDESDCVIDGGNSHYKDTLIREAKLRKKGILYVGAGISGGEEGALYGPSIMPGGSEKGYENCGQFLEAIAAKDEKGNPCCSYISPDGAGHFVKMVHNGIEYAEMQLLAEIYHFLRFHLGNSPDAIHEIFTSWRSNNKDSYLLEITADILQKKEGEDFLIDKVLDKAGQKGTGGWSTQAALTYGIPVSTISEAVMTRCLSAKKKERIEASKVYSKTTSTVEADTAIVEMMEQAYYAASLVNHAIGFDLMKQAAKENNWELNFSEIARIWTRGCIIRSDLMENLTLFFKDNNNTPLLMLPKVVETLDQSIDALTEVVSKAIGMKCPLPVLSAAANYLLNYTSETMSANMLQAQRDYFGAHTYQRVDKGAGAYFHTDWKNI